MRRVIRRFIRSAIRWARSNFARNLARNLTLLGCIELKFFFGPWLLTLGAFAWGQTPPPALFPAPPTFAFKASSLLQEKIPDSAKREQPSFVQANAMSGQTNLNTHLSGEVDFRRGDMHLKADEVDYDPVQDLLRAQGAVRINKAGNVYEGPLLELKVDAFEGFFTQPHFKLIRNDAYGDASGMRFIDEQHAQVQNATFTTCQIKPGPSWLPDWILRASKIDINNETNEGLASGASLSFKGMPLLPVPEISFPLSSERKSGLLPPTMGLDSIGGLEYTQPYYWNIAPNRDATLQATTWSKRGVEVGGEFRYLEQVNPEVKGMVHLDYMQHDTLRDSVRWGFSETHQGGMELLGEHLGLNLNLKRVSDDNYWKDFSQMSNPLSQRLLPTDVSMNWVGGPWSSTLRSLKWQTLQDLTAPITPPFDRLPQWITRYNPQWEGWNVGVQTDMTKFQANRVLACQSGTIDCQPNGARAMLSAKASYPIDLGYVTITPKVSVLSRAYEFDTPLLSNGLSQANVTVPTLSLDATTVLERDFNWSGKDYIQTLEPRVFFVNTPYRSQNFLPVYDTGRNDFNFSTVYTENAFSGYDRVSDDRLLTVGTTSRLIAPQTGEEMARFGIAQRFRLATTQVVLPSDLKSNYKGVSDLLLGASVNMQKNLATDATLQYSPDTHESMQTKLGARYYPSNYRLLSGYYSFQRDVNSELIDTAWQWPLSDLWGGGAVDLGAGQGMGQNQWFSVGRLNFDLQQHTVVNSIVGFEYDAGCWLGRVVFERLQVGANQMNQRIMFQLELVGFTRVGISPLQTLKDNIPRYQNLRDPFNSPSRFGNYE